MSKSVRILLAYCQTVCDVAMRGYYFRRRIASGEVIVTH